MRAACPTPPQAGDTERAPSEQWAGTVGPPGPALLAAAPEDEVLAEMLALQNELVQQAAANRARLVPALAGVLGELDARAAAAAQRAAEEEEVKAWIVVRLGHGRRVFWRRTPGCCRADGGSACAGPLG